jgi:retron-type reverse transcriptase
MHASALRTVSNLETLADSWRHIRRQANKEKGGSSGIDRLRPIDYKRNESSNLADLSTLISSGKFRFRDLRVTFIEKPTKGTRIICIPSVQDRIVQRALLHFLTSDDKCKILNTVSYGFT